MSDELKPCPFCGGAAIPMIDAWSDMVGVECSEDCGGGYEDNSMTPDELAEAWNRRNDEWIRVEIPTEPGWYWKKDKYDDDFQPVYVRRYDGKLCLGNWEGNWEIPSDAQWYKIPQPPGGNDEC